MIGTITFNPSIDQFIWVPRLVKDDANRAHRVVDYPGGKGVNVSKVIRELGGRTRAYSLVGGVTGELFKRRIADLGIPLTAVPVRGQTRVNVILTETESGFQTRVSAPGPPLGRKELARFLSTLMAARPKPFLWVFGGSLPAGTPPQTYGRFIHKLQRDGIRCVLDADGEALCRGTEAKPFLIKPNEFEMARLVGRSLKRMDEYLESARSLVERGVQIVVVSLAERGSLFVTRDFAFRVRVPRVAVQSKVGAGDSLIGGLMLGLCRRKSLKEAALLGAAASVSAVLREAPRLCLRSDIPKFLRKVKIEELR